MAIVGRNNPRNKMSDSPKVGARKKFKRTFSRASTTSKMSPAQRAALMKAQRASAQARKSRSTKIGKR